MNDLIANSRFAPSKWCGDDAFSNLPVFIRTYACKAGQGQFKCDAEQIAPGR